jgi:hypothetical protein
MHKFSGLQRSPILFVFRVGRQLQAAGAPIVITFSYFILQFSSFLGFDTT